MNDIVDALRSLSNFEHDDLSIGNDAADEIINLRQRIKDLEEEYKALHIIMTEVQANDRAGMYWLAKVRDIVGGRDFNEMVNNVKDLKNERLDNLRS